MRLFNRSKTEKKNSLDLSNYMNSLISLNNQTSM